MKRKVLKYFLCLCAVFFFSPSAEGGWDDGFKVVTISSGKDGSPQRIHYSRPESSSKKPLVVALHSWAGDYRQYTLLAGKVKEMGWNFIYPDCRGPNVTVKSCGSEFVISDIDEAIDWALGAMNVDERRIYVIGGSGGGYEALCMLMKSRHQVNTFCAWCPITDLCAWYEESRTRGLSYARDIIRCTGSRGGCLDIDNARARSPLWQQTPVKKLESSRIKLFAGINDGITGPVPFTHAIRFYNKVLRDLEVGDVSCFVPETDIQYLEENRSFPGEKKQAICGREVVYQRRCGNLELVIFQGGHEILYECALGSLGEADGF